MQVMKGGSFRATGIIYCSWSAVVWMCIISACSLRIPGRSMRQILIWVWPWGVWVELMGRLGKRSGHRMWGLRHVHTRCWACWEIAPCIPRELPWLLMLHEVLTG